MSKTRLFTLLWVLFMVGFAMYFGYLAFSWLGAIVVGIMFSPFIYFAYEE